jgi:hypothetical protein
MLKESLELMVKMTHEGTDMLTEEVIKLHDIARKIEQEIGVGQLSEDIRKAADRLNELLKRV